MSKITGGDLLVRTLEAQGVRQVFSIIGGQMCSVYDALSRRPGMNLVTLRNEAAAPMMAAGCVAVTGTPAVSMCTVGAGVVYEVAGLMTAWYSYLPVISISPQVQSWKMKPHQENLQGLNQDDIFKPITKWDAIVYHWDRIPALVQRALREALANAPGPVHLDLPVDVLFQAKKVNGRKLASIMPPADHTRCGGALPGPADQLAAVRGALAKARRPLAVIGQGLGRPGRFPEIRDHLNRVGLPTLLTDCSLTALDGRDEASAGALELFTGSATGLDLVRQSDLLLVMGRDDQVRDLLNALGPDRPPLAQVETDPSALLPYTHHYYGLNADPGSFLAGVAGDDKWSDWRGQVKDAGAGIARDLAESAPGAAGRWSGLAASLGPEDVVVVDGADPVREARAFLRTSTRRALMVMNTRDQAGVGLPFALGAKIGLPSAPVTLVTDRDSLLRQIQELQTAAGLGLDLSIVLTDPGAGAARDRTRAVLSGLGCSIFDLASGQAPDRTHPGRSAWLCA